LANKRQNHPDLPEKPLTWQQKLLLDLHDVLYVLAAFMLVYMIFFRVVVVVGTSMEGTLIDGDRLILLSSTVYKNPQQGDIIVASKESFKDGECIVKRVIATEGQKVDIREGIVYVDDVALQETYLDDGVKTKPNDVSFPLVVEEGKIFVLGDNRGASLDSRSPDVGLIDERQVLGKAIFLMMPGTKDGKVEADNSRIGVISDGR